MQLKKIQVSGFKSFVDSTNIRFPGELVSVVGPNGCGKSNVIDACRWVMGESSAKTLRGDNMADVIFNGSASRKPVGKASVELVFDNSDGKAAGNYAKFAEISVKRTLTRDGKSGYLINNLKVRRRDVLDLFRGTGLGPRSYSIIEQGMVSRIVEARPEDLRLFVEEAAGTSQYKERRRETENRIRHTRENLERLTDVRNELDKQLRRLDRQAKAASRYKKLKEQENQLAGQLMLMRLQAFEETLTEKDREGAQLENQLESAIADQRKAENQQVTLREQQAEAVDKQNEIQARYYSMGSEIKTIEQQITHTQENFERQDQEIVQLTSTVEARLQQINMDQSRLTELQQELAQSQPERDALEAQYQEIETQLQELEQQYQNCQQEIQQFNEASRVPAQQQIVHASKIEQIKQSKENIKGREQKLVDERQSLEQAREASQAQVLKQRVVEHDQMCATIEESYYKTEAEIAVIREKVQLLNQEISDKRTELQDATSRLISLEEIKAAALAQEQSGHEEWLAQAGLTQASRLADKVQVESGWERAADRLLRNYLSAFCVDKIDTEMLRERPDLSLTIAEAGMRDNVPSALGHRLTDKVKCESVDLLPVIGEVFICENIDEALLKQPALKEGQRVVTKDGILLGSNWIEFTSEQQQETGHLFRQEEISRLEQLQAELQEAVDQLFRTRNELTESGDQLEQRFIQERQQLNELRSENVALHNQLGREETRYNEITARLEKIQTEVDELQAQYEHRVTMLAESEALLEQAKLEAEQIQIRGEQLFAHRDELQQRLSMVRSQLSEIRDARHQKAMTVQRLESGVESLTAQIQRFENESQDTQTRLEALAKVRDERGELDALKTVLEEKLQMHVVIEQEFSQVKDIVGSLEAQFAEIERNRTTAVTQVNQQRQALEQYRLALQDVRTRSKTLEEQFEEKGYERQALLADWPEEADVDVWHSELENVRGKIDRIGPVNLVAIDEFEEESERKKYLDQQNDDLCEALETLEKVIRQIDKESRQKFRETYEALNAGFQDFFPRLFGGGSASLSLNSDDLLTAGVEVMARPPGKRNSTIHLLSGGEKALTAVALLFSLFKLNPAPFCMLDEVDAPLDDANVGRYCETLRSLSSLSQIVVITHNKITMEAADSLIGVTMAEPGVSRIVSVDINEAVKLAQS